MKIWYQNWWKGLAIALIFYTIIGGLLFPVPRVAIVQESIRNTHFHVSLWFTMMIILTFSLIFSIRYLRKPSLLNDDVAGATAGMGVLVGILGLATGSLWAKYTWGAWWISDPKLNGAAIAMLIYLAYFILRGSLEDEQQRARVSAVYNIFAYFMLIPLLFVLPRLTDSLHPGNGGNPGFSSYDLDSNLRLVFYPSIIGWTLLTLWMVSLQIRTRQIKRKMLDKMTDKITVKS
jgi:heme exporter protein C